MGKLNYLNVGCGNKFHPDWINVDMVPRSDSVITANFLNGIPLPDNSFDVVYHSQVLEHFPKEEGKKFMMECFRVLKPNGIIRVVMPDLENIVDQYKQMLNENLQQGNELSQANYDWIMLEMYDQTVRNQSGGQMAKFLQQKNMVNEKYVLDRIGFQGRSIRNSFLTKKDNSGPEEKKHVERVDFMSKMKSLVKQLIQHKPGENIQESEEYRIGKFRLGGEIHQWMYDRFSLSRLLKEIGFSSINVMTPFKSDIPDWDSYQLDVKDGLAFDPTSLFVEAKKQQ